MKPGLLLRAARMPLPKLLLRLEAAGWLCAARLALWLVPFPRLSAHIGTMQPPSVAEPIAAAAATNTALLVSQAVRVAAHHLPVEMVCLPQALAAWQMLHRRGVYARLHFGKPRSAGAGLGRETHAWLSSAGVEVTGYPVAHDCIEIGYVARTPGRGASERQS